MIKRISLRPKRSIVIKMNKVKRLDGNFQHFFEASHKFFPLCPASPVAGQNYEYISYFLTKRPFSTRKTAISAALQKYADSNLATA